MEYFLTSLVSSTTISGAALVLASGLEQTTNEAGQMHTASSRLAASIDTQGSPALVGSAAAQAQSPQSSAPPAAPTPPPPAAFAMDHGPSVPLYTEPNRTSAVDDVRSVVIYIFIITIFFGFFLILPGIRNEKFPTFLCITSSLLVSSIILVALFSGSSWHVAEAPIWSAYKAFSRDRIQGQLSVRIGLQSVNISLRAHRYYLLHASEGPIMMEDATMIEHAPPILLLNNTGNTSIASSHTRSHSISTNLADELLAAEPGDDFQQTQAGQQSARAKRQQPAPPTTTIKRLHVDINYNERFYWIGPEQMQQEHRSALQRGLPYPILTVVEYLSHDEAGFSWSRQYRAAGYYSTIWLWLGVCLAMLMFFLHCAAPKHGIYAMQLLGLIMLATNLTYFSLVPRGEHKLVIPFEGRPLSFTFGWTFWLVLFGGCLSLTVGSLIVLLDWLYPNYIFTTILDARYDTHHQFRRPQGLGAGQAKGETLKRPPFLEQQRHPKSFDHDDDEEEEEEEEEEAEDEFEEGDQMESQQHRAQKASEEVQQNLRARNSKHNQHLQPFDQSVIIATSAISLRQTSTSGRLNGAFVPDEANLSKQTVEQPSGNKRRLSSVRLEMEATGSVHDTGQESSGGGAHMPQDHYRTKKGSSKDLRGAQYGKQSVISSTQASASPIKFAGDHIRL